MVEPSAVQVAVMVALFSSVLLSSAMNSAEDFINASNLRRAEAGLCAQLIEPSGFPCSEHKTLTKDGFILGIQRVSSNSGNFRRQRGPPVLLIHGLFVLCPAQRETRQISHVQRMIKKFVNDENSTNFEDTKS